MLLCCFQLVVAKTSNIARMAQRIAKLVNAEAENTEDPEFRAKLEQMSRNIQDGKTYKNPTASTFLNF